MDYFELQKTEIFYFLSNAISTVSLYTAIEEYSFLNTERIAASPLETDLCQIRTERIMYVIETVADFVFCSQKHGHKTRHL
jgi:hypothetical protein